MDEWVYLKEGCFPVSVLNDVLTGQKMSPFGTQQVNEVVPRQIGKVISNINGLLVCRWRVIPDVYVWITVRECDVEKYPMTYLIEDVWAKY